MSGPGRVAAAKIRRLTSAGLSADRTMQRDIHYTLERYESRVPPVTISSKDSNFYHDMVFRIADKEHVYFFEAFWPCAGVPDFLRAEDIIQSGLLTLNGYSRNMKRALRQLIKEKATFEGMCRYPRKPDGSLDMQATPEPVSTLITTMEDVDNALYCGDSHVEEVIGYVDIPFNKSLNRVVRIEGSVPQRYNSRMREWENFEHGVYSSRGAPGGTMRLMATFTG